MTEATRVIRCFTEQVCLVLVQCCTAKLDMSGAGAERVSLSWTCLVLVRGERTRVSVRERETERKGGRTGNED